MAAPTPLPETFLACIDHTFTIGADTSVATLEIMDGGLTHSFGVDEMTNNQSGGAYDDVKTYETVDGQFTAVFTPTPAGTPPIFKAGDVFPLVIDNATHNGVYFSGNVRFNAVQPTVLDVKSGLKYQFTIKNKGAFTMVRPTPPG